MNTQTGGVGETTQSQPDTESTTDQFKSDIQAPAESETTNFGSGNTWFSYTIDGQQNPEEPAAETPVEGDPVKTGPVEQSEAQSQEKPGGLNLLGIQPDVQPPAMETMVNSISEPNDITAPSYVRAFDQLQQPEIDLEHGGENPIVSQLAYAENEDPVFFNSEDKQKYEEEKQFVNSSIAVRNYFNKEAEERKKADEALKANVATLSNKNTNYSSYDNVINSANNLQYNETFESAEVQRNIPDVKYNPSANMKTFMNIMNVDESQAFDVAKENIPKPQIAEYATDLNTRTSNEDRILGIENSLKTGVVSPETAQYMRSNSSLLGTFYGEGVKVDDRLKKDLEGKLFTLKQENSTIQQRMDDFDYSELKTEALNPQSKDRNLFREFEYRTNSRLKDVYKKDWQKTGQINGADVYQIPNASKFETSNVSSIAKDWEKGAVSKERVATSKAYAKWLDTTGREVLKADLKNGTQYFTNAEKNKFPESSKDPYLRELRNDLMEIEMKKNYEKTKQVDPYTYSGFKKEAERLSKESGTKLNYQIKTISNEVVESSNEAIKQWEKDNKPTLIAKVNSIKGDMDKIFHNNLKAALSSNPNANAIYTDYSNKIQSEKDPAVIKQLTAEMMGKLKSVPGVNRVFDDYDNNLQRAINKVNSDYFQEFGAFSQDVYNKSVEDLKEGIKKSTRDVYKSGVNNDLNTYENAQQVVNTREFKEASYYDKRKMIEDSWQRERGDITAMVMKAQATNKMPAPANKEEMGKHWTSWTGSKELTPEEKSDLLRTLPERTGYDARNRYIFYSVDDLLYNPKGKPTVYGIQSFAREQLKEIEAKEKALGISYSLGGGVQLDKSKGQFVNTEEANELSITKNYLNKILNTPETDQGTWNELLNGVVDNFELPFLGSVMGMFRNTTLKEAADKYSSGNMDTYDMSLVDAYAALNKIQQIRPNSTAYNIGSGLAMTSTFMLEMMATGGLNAVGRGAGAKMFDSIVGVAKSTADDAVRASVEVAAQSPEFLARTKSVVSYLTGAVAEGSVNPRIGQMTTERMLDRVTTQESGAYDGLIAQIDKNGEDAVEAFLKSYGNYIGMTAIERLGGHLPTSNISKNMLEYIGSSSFIKRSMVGRMMRDYGFKSVDEASQYIATTKMPWEGIVPEMIEEVLQGGWEALITGDKPVIGRDDQGEMNVMGMNAEEYLTTVGVVTIFGGTSALAKNVTANIGNTDVTIDTENSDGSSLSAIIPRDAWNTFNKTATDPNLSWRSSIDLISKTYDLDAKQQAALSNAFVKIRGKEIVEDQDYKDWKAENAKSTEQISKKEEEVKAAKAKAQEGMTDEQKAISDYKFMEVGKMQSARDNFYSLVEQNSEAFENNDMTINEENPDGSVTTTTVEQTATDLADKSKKRRAKKLTTGGGRAAKDVAKQKEDKAAKEEGIQFEAPSGITATEETPTESTITTPIDLSNDQENITGVSGEVGKGQEPIQTQPVAEQGQETPGVSGVVQETGQEVAIEQMPTSFSSLNDSELKGGKYFIPKSVYEQAYENDEGNKGYQSLDSIIARGGYTVKEMDALLPNWKQKVAELNSSKTQAAPAQATTEEQKRADKIVNSRLEFLQNRLEFNKENEQAVEYLTKEIESLKENPIEYFKELAESTSKDPAYKEYSETVKKDYETLLEAEKLKSKPTVSTQAAPAQATTEEAAPAESKAVPKNKKERIDAALKGDMVYHNWFGSTIESTPEQYNSALKEIAETGAIEDVYKYGKNISTNQGPSLDLYSSSLLNTSQEDAQFELNQRAKTAPAQTSKNLFDELESINQIKNAKDKQAAKKEFDKANGNKATKINTNFKTIFDSLSKNNLVKRRC